MARPILASLAFAILLAAKIQGSGAAKLQGSGLCVTVKAGDISTVRYLIEAGADVNSTCGTRYSVLQLATGYEEKDILKILIASGADVNYKDQFGVSALVIAANRGETDIVKILIDAGADVNAAAPRYVVADPIGYRPDRPEARVYTVINGSFPTRQEMGGSEWWTPLMWAVSNADIKMVNLLIAAGADVNYQNDVGDTALFQAVNLQKMDGFEERADSAEIVKSLVDAGADVNVSGEWNKMTMTPVMRAAMKKEEEVCKILIAAGADTGIISLKYGWKGDEQVIKKFLTRLEPSRFLIVAGDHVESFDDIEKAKAKLDKVTTGSRLIAEVDSRGKLKRDPHEVGGQNQGLGSAAGFNKFWSDWDDINRMMDLAQQFLDANNGIDSLPFYHAMF